MKTSLINNIYVRCVLVGFWYIYVLVTLETPSFADGPLTYIRYFGHPRAVALTAFAIFVIYAYSLISRKTLLSLILCVLLIPQWIVLGIVLILFVADA